MADVRLDFYDVDEDALPDVCMKCGGPSVVRPVKQFSWTPYWARFMPWVIRIAFIKRRRVPTPLCERHKNHWVVRHIVAWGGLGLMLLLFFGGIIVCSIAEDDDPGGPISMAGALLLVCAGVVLIAWLITMIVLAVTQIGVAEITEDTILLKNVHGDFCQAYREATRPTISPELDDAIRDQWGRPTGRRRDEPRRPSGDYPPDDKVQRG